MNSFRCSTVMPSALPSTTKALMPPRCPSLLGTLAITTGRSATMPFVVHSLTPFITYSLPSADGRGARGQPGGI